MLRTKLDSGFLGFTPGLLLPSLAVELSETTDTKANVVTYLPVFFTSLQIWTLFLKFVLDQVGN